MSAFRQIEANRRNPVGAHWRSIAASHGFSVREVLDTVKRVSGVDFRVENAARRSGDRAQIIAETKLIRQTLAWRPRFDDLSTIIAHALPWERTLAQSRSERATDKSNVQSRPGWHPWQT
jgi:UDP-glucose 4-epimerase